MSLPSAGPDTGEEEPAMPRPPRSPVDRTRAESSSEANAQGDPGVVVPFPKARVAVAPALSRAALEELAFSALLTVSARHREA
ncbi:hypothetical protein [Roseivivax halodurans]|nr:hypothetical protein [Roseivivax halodurans]